MQRPPTHRFFAYALILTLVGSLFSIVLPAFQPSYASHENITVNISGDDVTDTYGPNDDVAIAGVIEDIVENEDVIIRIGEPGDSTPNQVQADEPTSSGNFDYLYEVPNSPEEGVYTVEVEYDGDEAYTYFIVDDDEDTILVLLDQNDGIYEADDDVTISGSVDNEDSAEEFVHIIVLDPTNDEIVDEDEVELGAGSLSSDEFEHEFSLDTDAPHGRYAVMVTYDIDDQEGSTLFEIEDDDAGSGGGGGSSGGGDEGTDGDITAQIEEATYAPGDTVTVEGNIDNYDSSDNEDLGIMVLNPDDEEIAVEDSENVASDGDFTFEYDLEDDADEGEYIVVITYDTDELELTFDVEEGAGGGGSSDELTVKLNKGSYLAGDTMTVTGTVADVEEDELVSVYVHEPGGQVILESGSFKNVLPSSSGAYSATIVLPSDLDVDDDYTVRVGYFGESVQVSFDITGVSSTPSDEITVETDEDEYSIGSTVEVSGEVPDVLLVDGEPLVIRFNKPDGNPCRIDQVSVPASGSYTYELVLGGTCGVGGEYEVEVTYRGEQSKTTFELTGPSASEYSLDVGGDTYPIKYELSSGSINSMFVRPTEDKLVININAEEDGQLTVVLPREVIDAVEDGEDIAYVVTIEDESGEITTVDVEESENTDDERTLVIDYEAGAARIEIAGTQVVPEFGAIAAIVMAVAIVGIIVATAKYNKLSLFRQ